MEKEGKKRAYRLSLSNHNFLERSLDLCIFLPLLGFIFPFFSSFSYYVVVF